MSAIAAGKASARLLQQRPITIGLENAKIPNVGEQIKKLLAGLPPPIRSSASCSKRVVRAFKHRLTTSQPAPRCTRPTAGSAIRWRARAPGSARSSTAWARAGWIGCSKTCSTPTATSTRCSASPAWRLTDGRVVAGLLLRQEGEVLVIADALGKEIRVPQDEVEEKQIVQMSPMPADMARQIPEKDFYHLLDYLLSRRDEKPVK